MIPLLPPVLFPGEAPLPRDVRLWLLFAFAVHLVAIPFLARPPYGPLAMPVVFFLGVSVLWALPGLLVFQSALYAINAVLLLTGAWVFGGARYGENLLLVAGAVPFLLAALPMACARFRLRGFGKPSEGIPPPARPAPQASGAWALAAAGLAILAAGLGVLASRKGEGERAARTVPEGQAWNRAIPAGSQRLNDRSDQVWTEIEARIKASEKRREDAMRRLASLSPDEMFVNDSEAPASFLGEFNLSGGRRYFGNRTYSWETGYAGDRYLPFSCRRGILRNLAPRWTHSLLRAGEASRGVAQGMVDDSLFRTFRCREFPESSSVYFAQVDEHSRTAAWKRMRPGYEIRIGRRVEGLETVWPRLEVEFHPDPTMVDPSQSEAQEDPEGIGDLFMVSDDPPPGGDPFPYARLTFARGLPLMGMDLFDAPGFGADPAPDTAISFDLAGFDSALVKRVWIEARISLLENGELRTEATRAVLKCRTREDTELVLAESKRPPDDAQALRLRFNEVVVTDINGDGNPDFLVQGNYLPERLILTRKNAIQAEIPLFPGRGQ